MEGIAGGKFGASWCAWVPERNQLCMWAFAGLKKTGKELDNEKSALCNLKWSDLNGKPIYYKFTPDTLPYKRGFALHADSAYAVAVGRKVVPKTFDFRLLEHDSWSNTAVKKKVRTKSNVFLDDFAACVSEQNACSVKVCHVTVDAGHGLEREPGSAAAS